MSPPSPTSSCLLFLFADQFLPREHTLEHVLGTIGVPTPGTGTLIPLGPLEVHLLAVALWDLDARRVIRLEERNDRPRGRRLHLQRTADGDGDGDDWGGVEGRLLELLPEEGIDTWHLVLDHWVGEEQTLALNAVVLEAQIEAMRLDLIDLPETPQLIPGYLGHHTFPRTAVHPGPVERCRVAATDLAERWAEAEQGPLVPTLLRECNRVLSDARPAAGYGTAF